MFENFFKGLFDTELTMVISVRDFMLCLGAALAVGLLITLAYMFRTRYTKSFVITLALLPAVVSVVIMMVNGNVGTGVAVAGAFSLVRFRSVPGTAKEICVLFLAMAVVLLVVVVGEVLQQLYPLRTVDGQRIRGGQGILQKLLQPRAVHHDHVCPVQKLHIVDGQSIVMQTAGLSGVQPLHRHTIHPFGDCGGKQIDRVGGGHDAKPLLFPGGRSRSAAAGQQHCQRRGNEKNASFHAIPRFCQEAESHLFS